MRHFLVFSVFILAFVLLAHAYAPPMLDAVLTAPVSGTGVLAGRAVDALGDRLVMGARLATRNFTREGAAFMYRRSVGASGTWSLVASLYLPNPVANAYFGSCVALGTDFVLVGASGVRVNDTYNAGTVTVFGENVGGTGAWGYHKTLFPWVAEWGEFGRQCAVDGDVAVIGASVAPSGGTGRGAAYIFTRNAGGTDNWGGVRHLTASDASDNSFFGAAVAVSGNTTIIGASLANTGLTSAGKAYVFDRDFGGADAWGERKIIFSPKEVALGFFGAAVSIVGDMAVIGSTGSNASSVTNSGASFVMMRNQGGAHQWGHVATLVAPDAKGGDRFGSVVALTSELVLVGAPDRAPHSGIKSGGVYAFAQNTTSATYDYVATMNGTDFSVSSEFGTSLAFGDGFAAIGAPSAVVGNSSNGATFVYTMPSSNTTSGSSSASSSASLGGLVQLLF